MTAKEFIEDWYGKPIPPDWDLEHEPLQNLSINDLERMLKQYTLSIIEKAVESEIDDWEFPETAHDSVMMAYRILNRVKQATFDKANK